MDLYILKQNRLADEINRLFNFSGSIIDLQAQINRIYSMRPNPMDSDLDSFIRRFEELESSVKQADELIKKLQSQLKEKDDEIQKLKDFINNSPNSIPPESPSEIPPEISPINQPSDPFSQSNEQVKPNEPPIGWSASYNPEENKSQKTQEEIDTEKLLKEFEKEDKEARKEMGRSDFF